MTTTFENAQVGDKVWHLLGGDAEVISWISTKIFEVKVSYGFTEWVDTDGFIVSKDAPFTRLLLNRVLYWSKPEIIASEQPKRKKFTSLNLIMIYDVKDNKILAIDDDIERIEHLFLEYNEPFRKQLKTLKATTEEFEVEE